MNNKKIILEIVSSILFNNVLIIFCEKTFVKINKHTYAQTRYSVISSSIGSIKKISGTIIFLHYNDFSTTSDLNEKSTAFFNETYVGTC